MKKKKTNYILVGIVNTNVCLQKLYYYEDIPNVLELGIIFAIFPLNDILKGFSNKFVFGGGPNILITPPP